MDNDASVSDDGESDGERESAAAAVELMGLLWLSVVASLKDLMRRSIDANSGEDDEEEDEPSYISLPSVPRTVASSNTTGFSRGATDG